MTKPDDIPQDVILEAQRYAYETETSGDDVAAITSEIGVRVIARAIMAEREACAAVADEDTGLAPGGFGNLDLGPNVSRRIATAIRNR